MINKNKKLLLALGLSTALGACTMVPDFIRPELGVASQWRDIPGYESVPGEQAASALGWNEFFQDPALNFVIKTALENNKDLKNAALNIEAARALYRIERADLVPSVSAGALGSRQKISDEASSTGNDYTTKRYEANAGVSSYEVDLFGRVKSLNESALNEYFATQSARDTLQNSLIAEVANAYLQFLADRKLLTLTEKTLEAQQQTYDLLSETQAQGIATESDVSRAQTAVETARVNLHQYRRFVEQDANALVLLMGVAYDDAVVPVSTLEDVSLPENLEQGLPSEVLISRPDIKQAEYELMARNADIGAARAAFFPTISLTGSFGFASQNLSDLFAGGAFGAWSFVPQITMPIFEGGRNKANLDLAEIRKEQAVVHYEKVIQTAFREVADELAARATLTEQLSAQRSLVKAAQNVYDISNDRYKSGIDSFLSVLDAQRELYTYQQAEIRIEQQRLSNLVNLYKVLGGGSYNAVVKAEVEAAPESGPEVSGETAVETKAVPSVETEEKP